jgi:hypothetical protein
VYPLFIATEFSGNQRPICVILPLDALSALPLHLPLLLVLFKEPLLWRFAGDSDQPWSLLLGFSFPIVRHLPRDSEIGCFDRERFFRVDIPSRHVIGNIG